MPNQIEVNSTQSHSPTPVLFVHFGDHWLRGSEMCLLNLLQRLDSRYQAFLWTNNASLAERTRTMGITTQLSDLSIPFSLDSSNRQWSMHTWRSQYHTAKQLIADWQIKLIHINSAAPCQWVIPASINRKIPAITQLHCHYNLHDRITLGIHFSPTIIGVSHAVTKSLIDEGYSQNRINVIHNGVPNPQPNIRFNLRQQLNIASDARVMVTVGSLIQRKGVDRLIDAVAHLKARRFECQLVVIGDGPERDALQQQTKKLQADSIVHFVGEQSNVAKWLSGGADLFISGARSEAFGLVLVEAALAKLPIIAPNVGGISEVVEHQKSALLYCSEHCAHQSLTAAIERLFNQPRKAERLAHNAYLRAKQRFSLGNNQAQIERLYQQTLEQPQPLTAFEFIKAAFAPLPSLLRLMIRKLRNAVNTRFSTSPWSSL